MGAKVSIGGGVDPDLARAMRVLANSTEYTPLALLLIAFNEALGAPALTVHGLCALRVVRRGVHFPGIRATEAPMRFRRNGMTLTFGTLALGALGILALTALRLLG